MVGLAINIVSFLICAWAAGAVIVVVMWMMFDTTTDRADVERRAVLARHAWADQVAAYKAEMDAKSKAATVAWRARHAERCQNMKDRDRQAIEASIKRAKARQQHDLAMRRDQLPPASETAEEAMSQRRFEVFCT